jgi:hypothetical protein
MPPNPTMGHERSAQVLQRLRIELEQPEPSVLKSGEELGKKVKALEEFA